MSKEQLLNRLKDTLFADEIAIINRELLIRFWNK